MNDKERKILESFRFALNPELLIEEVVSSSIAIIQILPGSGTNIEYKHDYEDPEYWKDSAAFGSEKAPVKEILRKSEDQNQGVTVMLMFVDRALRSMGADYTGAKAGPDWLWVKKADDSPIDASLEKEGEPGQGYEEIGYAELGYKPSTFIVNWLESLLSPYGSKISKDKLSHPPFKAERYPKGYDIKDIVYYSLPEGFKSKDAKQSFQELVASSEKKPWFDVVGYPQWGEGKGDFGRWFVIGKTSEPGFEMDVAAKDEIDSKLKSDVQAKKYKFLDKQFTKYSHRDPFDRFNVKAAKEKWDKSIALISNILSRSGTVQDDRKLTPYYLSMALEKLLKEHDPVDFEQFTPEHMEEWQANELFGFPRKGIKGIIKDIIMKIDANPGFLNLESTIKQFNALVEDIDMDDEETQMDVALYMRANDEGFTRDDLAKMFADKTKASKSLERLEKEGHLANKAGRYVANPNSVMKKPTQEMRSSSKDANL